MNIATEHKEFTHTAQPSQAGPEDTLADRRLRLVNGTRPAQPHQLRPEYRDVDE